MERLDFLRPLEDITLNEVGLEAVFECEISKDGLQADWLKDGKTIKASENVLITSKGCIHRLVVSSSKSEDEGQYTVIFKTPEGKSSAQLLIKGKNAFRFENKNIEVYNYSYLL